VLFVVLGDDAFGELANAYLNAHPSRRASIRWFGHALAPFMEQRDDLVSHSALADLARMEWAIRDAFDAADIEPLGVSDLAAIEPTVWPTLKFAPASGVTLLELDWAIEPIWARLTEDQSAETGAPEAYSHTLLIWRRELETNWRSLDPDEAGLLADCLAGVSFEALCERAAQECGNEAALRVAGLLRIWVEAGVLVRQPGPD
jgi:hypothetical protein